MRVKLVPPGAVGRVLAVVALTGVIGLSLNTLVYEGTSRFSIREEEARRTSEHIVVVSRMLEGEDPARRARIVEYASTEHFKLGWFRQPIEPGARSDALTQMHRQMVVWEPSLAGKDLRLHLGSPGEATEVSGSLQLSDGTWLHFRAQDLVGKWPLKLRGILIASLPMIALVIIALVTLRVILRPLGLLAQAVTRVGYGDSSILPEQGPAEFRHLIRAYNDMQTRIVTMIKDRTEALAAVGHDLRTPLARLRLSVDCVDDAEMRNTLTHDLDEMELMLDSLLTYFRGDDHSEKPVLVDLAVLVTTVVDDLQDRGFDITYEGPEHCDATLRLVEFKRALSNLTNNAVQYGDHASVRFTVDDSVIRIFVEDDGPGIPEADMQRVLIPFQRLDPARQRNTSGVGLGIPIAVRAIAAAGGKLILSNRPQGGLCAQIVLPRQTWPARLTNTQLGALPSNTL
ncbi:HAMP domain-containing protein [Steroidobacter sp. S1-65]|uniref:histidine kinase n=1 Tax=Steroidobacter gossypii TaxID=2805490 RepID=A0ABS1X0V7_9GAMM|nr:ATP-binding protein [Steroidobacter gossypii]MBM0106837.1 HAMP domain-containing protein [Steroidobacter gossypii]